MDVNITVSHCASCSLASTPNFDLIETIASSCSTAVVFRILNGTRKNHITATHPGSFPLV